MNYTQRQRFKWFIYIVFLLLSSLYSRFIYAGEHFNPALLGRVPAEQDNTDLSVFEKGDDRQLPGVYRVDIAINDDVVTTQSRDVVFTLVQENQTLTPCITVEELKIWGVRTQAYPQLSSGAGKCSNIHAIPGAFFDFRFSQQLLNISIPQEALSSSWSRDSLSPEEWDEGIMAGMINYRLTGTLHKFRGISDRNQEDYYLNLRPGLNIGAWRVRNYTIWQHNNFKPGRWDNVYNYLQRDVPFLTSQLTLGDGSTTAGVFNNVSFRGVQLSSDDDMLPASMRSYAPVIRGIARSESQVIIRQNGYVVYQTNVAPGAFAITDIPSFGSGELNVTVREADGTEQHLIVPYTTLPSLLREGSFRYDLTGGQYRSYDPRVEKYIFSQGTVFYGLPRDVTLYAGIQNAERYHSLALGVGEDVGQWGALSSGIAYSSSILPHEKTQNGWFLQQLYNKDILSSRYHITLAGYRYSPGYRALNEALEYRRNSVLYDEKRRNRAEMAISHGMGSLGSLNFSLVSEDYWNNQRRRHSLNLGYNLYIQGINISTSYAFNQSTSQHGINDRLFSLNLSVPLESRQNLRGTYNVTQQRGKAPLHNAGVNGTLFEGDNLDWGIYTGWKPNNESSFAGNVNWASSRGTLSGGYSNDREGELYTYGAAGSIVMHEDGVTFSGPLGETNALIKVPGAAGVRISNSHGNATDSGGYTVVPWLLPYKKNEFILDGESLPENIEVAQMSHKIVPTRGAIVRAEYLVSSGYRMLLTLVRPDGQPLPFGAVVTQPESKTSWASIVDDSGQVYLSGLQGKGKLLVKWNDGTKNQCLASYTMRDKNPGTIPYMDKIICR